MDIVLISPIPVKGGVVMRQLSSRSGSSTNGRDKAAAGSTSHGASQGDPVAGSQSNHVCCGRSTGNRKKKQAQPLIQEGLRGLVIEVSKQGLRVRVTTKPGGSRRETGKGPVQSAAECFHLERGVCNLR